MALPDIFINGDGQGPSYLLGSKLNSVLRRPITFGPQSVTLPRHGVDCLLTLTFSGSGEFQTTNSAGATATGALDYLAELTASDAAIQIREAQNGHGAGSCSWVVRAGTGAALTFNVTATLSGPGWSGTTQGPFAGSWAAVAEVSRPLWRYLSLSVAGAADVTLSAAQAENDVLELTGALTGSISLVVPVAPEAGSARPFLVFNNTSGAFTVTVKTSGGTGPVVAQGKRALLYADSVNVQRQAAEV